jgi:hypothetical protein
MRRIGRLGACSVRRGADVSGNERGWARRVAGIAAGFLMLATAQALAATNSVTWSGPGDFDDETITFPGFVANKLESITGPGIFHNHGDTSVIYYIQIQLNGVWTQIFSDQPSDGGIDYNLSDISTPIMFPTGTVTGIRVFVSVVVGNAFHSFMPTFNFDQGAGTEQIVGNFLSTRADVITANDPDLTSRLFGESAGAGAGPLGFVATGTSDNMQMSMSTSLSRIANAHSAVAAMAANSGRTPPLPEGGSRFALPYDAPRSAGADLAGARAQMPYNDISPLGTYTDSFDTERWLARAQLTGDFHFGNFSFAPHARVLYFEDAAETYTDSLGTVVAGQTETLGRFTFGPRVGYVIVGGPGAATLEPYAALEGIWDFDQANTVDPTTGLTAFSDDLRARAELGVKASFSRWTVSGEGFYDGIGADMDAYGGKVRAGISLN